MAEKCPNCGRILNDKIIDNKTIDNILSLNNNINMTLLGLKNQIENIVNELINKKDMYISSQLKNVNTLINNLINEDIKKINNELNKIKKNNNYIANNINIKENKNELKNEIICII